MYIVDAKVATARGSGITAALRKCSDNGNHSIKAPAITSANIKGEFMRKKPNLRLVYSSPNRMPKTPAYLSGLCFIKHYRGN